MSEPLRIALVLTTVPDAETAQRIARQLVETGLAACVHLHPAGRSVYRWQGEVHDDEEFALTIKTVRERLDAVQAAVLKAHPYELPELLVVDCDGGSAAYLEWVRQATAP